MKIALCNEVLRNMEFAAQCDYAAALGYDGLEVAPFTLSDEPHLLSAEKRAALRRAATDAGIAVTGLHWLLVAPAGLSLNGPDAALRQRTRDVMLRLVELCAELGGTVLVHGSPGQRSVAEGDDKGAAWERARESFAAVAEAASRAGVTYCIEPLSRRETNFINTVEEAARMVRAVGHESFRTMIDTSAASSSESGSVAALLDRWLPSGLIAHVQVNDRNRRGPGEGSDRFGPVFAALQRHGYDRVVAVEPFVYEPDGRACAARSVGYVRGVLEGLSCAR
ncbi:MAG TPA: sugar phosphate isomerase/epimerase family protein [Alphaproteobacteria bacterium]|nr:sugar phosphate isomerase/epimerase family protein [Alphaproteobacteria bacterium]